MKCGLLGRKLGHSYSPQIHSCLGGYSYTLFEKEPEDLEDFLKNGDFTGINVTIPYKKEVIPYLHQLSDTAQKLKAVNTVIRRKDGTLYGHNTDYYGFQYLLNHTKLQVLGKKVLVLGSGGASNTVCAVLKEKGASVIVVSRSGENNYENIPLHKDASAIINTTPVGMYPHTEKSPVDLSLFSKLEAVIDVIYNPAKTKLLLDAEKLGIPCENGLRMLIAQAKEAAEFFEEKNIPNHIIEDIYTQLSHQMQNIVLIGMPGSGKTTIAKTLAEKLYRKAVDSDEKIMEAAKKSIPAIFSQEGEKVFRNLESQILATLGMESNLVIATGGGCVTRIENLDSLRQNGIIFWLKRDLEKLPTEGRPLSQSNDLSKMYLTREPLYQKFADYIIDNNGTIEQTTASILHILEEKDENTRH